MKITTENFQDLISKIDVDALPAQLKQGIETINRNTVNGTDWTEYNTNGHIARMVDDIFEKLENHLPAELGAVHPIAIRGSRKNADGTYSTPTIDWRGHGAWHGGLAGKLRSVKVIYVNDDFIETSMAAHLSDDDIFNYHKPGKVFNVGFGPGDNLQAVKSVEITDRPVNVTIKNTGASGKVAFLSKEGFYVKFNDGSDGYFDREELQFQHAEEVEEEIELLYVDDFSRGVYKRKKTGEKLVDVDSVLHTMTDYGEPNYPINKKWKIVKSDNNSHPDIKIDEIRENEYFKIGDKVSQGIITKILKHTAPDGGMWFTYKYKDNPENLNWRPNLGCSLEGNLDVANEIYRQLGHNTMFMLGAKDIMGDDNALVFRIRGSQKWKKIKVKLTDADLYDVTFFNWRKKDLSDLVKETHTGIYVDMLHALIEKETGLRTSLGFITKRAVKGSRKTGDGHFTTSTRRGNDKWSGHGAWHEGLRGLPIGLKGKIHGLPFFVMMQYDFDGNVAAQVYRNDKENDLLVSITGDKQRLPAEIAQMKSAVMSQVSHTVNGPKTKAFQPEKDVEIFVKNIAKEVAEHNKLNNKKKNAEQVPAYVAAAIQTLQQSGISRVQARNVLAYIGDEETLQNMPVSKLRKELVRIPKISGASAEKILQWLGNAIPDQTDENDVAPAAPKKPRAARVKKPKEEIWLSVNGEEAVTFEEFYKTNTSDGVHKLNRAEFDQVKRMKVGDVLVFGQGEVVRVAAKGVKEHSAPAVITNLKWDDSELKKKKAKRPRVTAKKAGTSGEPVERLDDDVKFLKRYLLLDGKTKTKEQLKSLLAGLQKAILDVRIRKTSHHAKQVERMQDNLIDTINKMAASVKVMLHPTTKKELEQIINSESQMTSITLLKQFVALTGRKGVKEKAQALMSRMDKAHKVEKIGAHDKYHTQVLAAFTALKDYVDGKSEVIEISKAELNGFPSFLRSAIAGAVSETAKRAIEDTLGEIGASYHSDKDKVIDDDISSFKQTPANPHVIDDDLTAFKRSPVTRASVRGLGNISSVEQMKQQQFEPIGLSGKWKELIGEACIPMHMLMYGDGGSGKSGMALAFSQYVSEKGHPVLYVADEQFNTPTFTKLLNDANIRGNHNFHIVGSIKGHDLKKYHFIVFDSKDSMKINVNDFRALKKANPKQSFILTSQGKKDGDFRGSEEWRNEVDTMVYFPQMGTASTLGEKNRWGAHKEVMLFPNPNKTTAKDVRQAVEDVAHKQKLV